MTRLKRSLKILLVDDDPDILEVLTILFELDGADVSCALSYNEALELIEAKEFDIVITDYRMPRMHGLYLLDMIKDIQPDMPVIIMTAYQTEQLEAEAVKKKADLILTKPFTYERLLEGIRKLMKKKWQNQSGTKKQ